MRRTRLPRLAATLTAVALLLGQLPHAAPAAAAADGLDRVQGSGAVDPPNTSATHSFTIDAFSGPSGADAGGTFTVDEGPYAYAADVECLTVDGNRAVVAGRITSWPPGVPETTQIITLYFEDNGGSGDAFSLLGYGGHANPDVIVQPDCTLYAYTGTPLSSGEIIIVDEFDRTGFVQADGTQLTLDGAEYTFTGMNVYNANNRVPWCWYPMDFEFLYNTIPQMGPGVEVIRAWFFQDFATTSGVRDWSAFDATLTAARDQGKKLIVTLGNHWADCDSEGEKTADWYDHGYREQPGSLPTSYRDFVAEVVDRYKFERSILMWQLLNEAEVPVYVGTECDEPLAHAVLKSWAADVSSLIKSIDPVHLVSIGTIGSGQCGAQYTDYKSLHDLPTVDLCEFHDYSTDLMPGDEWNGLAFRLQQCGELGKPLFVGETGITPSWPGLDGTLAGRAELFRNKLIAQFSAGVVGEVLWAWNAFGSLTTTYDIGPDDPVLAILADLDAPPNPDVDGDGVHDAIDTGNGTFTSGATSGAIVATGGNQILVSADPAGVRIAVSGGAANAVFDVCGFSLQVAPGSEVVVACGSITVQVVVGTATVMLGDGVATVQIPAGTAALIEGAADGGFAVTHLGGSAAIILTVDGVTAQIQPGSPPRAVKAWDFVEFSEPVTNDGVRNVVKAGQAIPLKWRVLDAGGAPVTNLAGATIRVTGLSCSEGTGTDQLEETAAGSSGLLNLGNGYYQLNWKSPKGYANSCKTLRLDMADGVEHVALFQFSR